eukprot:UN31966
MDHDDALKLAHDFAGELLAKYYTFSCHHKSNCWGYYWDKIELKDIDMSELIQLAKPDIHPQVLMAKLTKTDWSKRQLEWGIYVSHQTDGTYYFVNIHHTIGDGATLVHCMIDLFKPALQENLKKTMNAHKKRKDDRGCCGTWDTIPTLSKLLKMPLVPCTETPLRKLAYSRVPYMEIG